MVNAGPIGQIMSMNPYILILVVVLGIVALIMFGVIGIGLMVGLMIWLPRALLAMGIGLVGLLAIFQRLPLKGQVSVYIGLGCFLAAFLVGTGVLGI